MKRRTLVGAITAGAAAAMAATVFGGARWLARSDRRRGSALDGPIGPLAYPGGVRHHTVATADGARLHVVEAGPESAPALVLLHGVTLTARIWAHQLADLGGLSAGSSGGFRVLAPDWRGHGESTVGSAGYGLGVLADDLRTVLDHFELEGAVVVGHSMGGMALMRYCALVPGRLSERVSGVVFASTAAGDVGRFGIGRLGRGLSAVARRSPGLAERAMVPPSGDLGYVYSRMSFGASPDARVVEQIRSITDSMAPAAAAPSVLSLVDHDERATLSSLRVPALAMVGTHDRLTPERQGREIADLAPKGELLVFEGAGHMLMLERRERFNTALAEFAERCRATRHSRLFRVD